MPRCRGGSTLSHFLGSRMDLTRCQSITGSEHEEHACCDKHTINFSNQLREVLRAHVFKDAGACNEVKATVWKW
jgi:hypothetical protein